MGYLFPKLPSFLGIGMGMGEILEWGMEINSVSTSIDGGKAQSIVNRHTQ